MKTVQKFLGGRTLTIETGKLAKQAHGAATAQYGETIVLATAVSKHLEEPPDFVPLSVEYREKTFAVGKIPGGFFKREGRPTTKEILTMRLIDRSLRPLFIDTIDSEVQIIVYVLSADQENDPDVLAMVAASTAAVLAEFPIQAAVGSVRVGQINNEFVLNPTHEQIKQSSMDLVVAGTDTAITMVEGEAKEISEETLINAIFYGHEAIKELVQAQIELAGKAPQAVSTKEECQISKEIEEKFGKEITETIVEKQKKQRDENLKNLYEKIKAEYIKEDDENAIAEKDLKRAYDKKQKEIVRKLISEGKRADGRGLKDIRSISCEVGLLPRAHGSALFTRGETQALVTTTLGTSMDAQMVEGLQPEVTRPFMLHYNFPPFCVGEVRFLRGPSRRDIGHGALSERSVEMVLPEERRFPYTVRIVSEILESNGSSSMATVCGATLSLMDAGVPIKRPVAGIAMGLVKEADDFYVLSDIMGLEDHYGDMDFKVAGTQRGITGFQMDIKISGVSREILITALEQAKEGRFQILREMITALDRPRRDISPYAPRVFQIQVPTEKISIVIGPGGKTIRGIQEATGAKIDIKDDGNIMVFCKEKAGAAKAKEMLQQITEEVKVGKIYSGKVTSVKDFGAFVEIIPGMEGLVHVSELEKNYVQNVGDVVKVGDEISVKVLAIDDQNRIKLSKKAVDRETKKTR